jgi:homocysteine S-methyltransferase
VRFREALSREPFILTEGAVIERLGRASSLPLDPHILHARLAADVRGRNVLGGLYRGYLEVGRRHGLPMVLLTPTWRASAARLRRAGFASADFVNRECCDFLAGLVAEYGDYARSVYIGGLMGCIGDAYLPQEALSREEAALAHAPQARALAAAGVDFLLASTLPALSEAVGMAVAMAAAAAEAGLPYLLSFVVRPTGTLLDGTPLHLAVRCIDAEVFPQPLCYLLNCVHPTVYAQAIQAELELDPTLCERVAGVQGNTSCRTPEELDTLAFLDTEEPRSFAAAMLKLHLLYGAKVLGGCCGTDERHINWIAHRMAQEKRRRTDASE